MCCRLGYRQAESCKHRRSFQEFHSPENLWNATPLQNRLLAVIGGGMPESKENVTVCWSSRGPPYGEMELGLAFENEGGKCLRAA